jgi:hypothetical protein
LHRQPGTKRNSDQHNEQGFSGKVAANFAKHPFNHLKGIADFTGGTIVNTLNNREPQSSFTDLRHRRSWKHAIP